MAEFYNGIPKIEYEGKNSTNPFAFKYYNPNEVIGGKAMKDQLKFAMSYWHTLCAEGADMFGVGTADKSFGTTREPMELAKAKVKAGFELMEKLGIEYFCFHDADIAPGGATLEEFYKNEDIISQEILSEMKRTGIKCLWGTANCFSHPRYMHGAGTSPNE
jgi:xylose isomerase